MKRTISLVLVLVLSLSLVFVVIGMTLQFVECEKGLFTNAIDASFMPGHKGTGEYQTNPNKVVKQCWVRLIEGNVDTGRVFSAIGSQTPGGSMIHAKTQKNNNILHACQFLYGWFYY